MKDIKGYEGLYAVTSCGKVWSYRRGIFLKPLNVGNYQSVRLSDNGKVKHCYIHRLVAEAYIPNPDGLSEVNHKNKNPKDNNVNNLEWCTRLYNVQYSKAKRVLCIETGIEYIGAREAGRQLGISGGDIGACCRGRYKTYGGYHWKYVEEEVQQ